MRSHRFLLPMALALALLALAGCRDPKAQLAEHEAQGQAYLEQEKWPEAAIEFRSMLQIDPNDAQAHYGLAKALLGSQDPRKAYWELQETVRLDPENLDARLQYGQFLLFGKEDEQRRAVEMADAILAKEPGRWEAQVLKARALGNLSRPEEAGQAYRAAVEAAPHELTPRLLLANYLRTQGDLEAAEAAYRELPKIQENFTSWVALAGFLSSDRKRDAEAEAAYRRALELATPKEQVAAYSLLASFLISRERSEEAEKVLRQGIEAAPQQLELKYTLARFYHVQGRRAEADAMIQEATRAHPDDPKPFLLLSAYRGQNGDLAGALEAAEQALAAAPDDHDARLRKAEVLVDLGYRSGDSVRIAKGRAIVDAILSHDESDPQAQFVRAKIHLAEGKPKEAEKALRRVLDTRPRWAQAHFLLGSTLYVAGDPAAARGELVRALELDANLVEAQKTLTRVHAALGDDDLAVEAGRRALRMDPGDSSMHVVVAQSLVRQQEREEALEELQKIPEDNRGSEAWYAIGRVESLLGRSQDARRDLLRALDQAPARFEILRALLSLDLREGHPERSAKLIAAAVESQPDDAHLHQLQGEVLLYTGHPKDGEASLRRAIELDPNDLAAYQTLARYLALSGRPDEVLATYERALAANPESGTLNLVVGSLYESRGRIEDAMARYEEAIRLDPDLGVAKNNLAWLMAERGGSLDRALDLAQEAKALLPDNPSAADTLGWVLYKKRVPSAAIGYLREAVRGMPPDSPQLSLVRHHLALAYEADHQLDRARATWQQALEDIEARAKGEGRHPEPPWTADIRASLKRLGS